jgi:hypothetical protein
LEITEMKVRYSLMALAVATVFCSGAYADVTHDKTKAQQANAEKIRLLLSSMKSPDKKLLPGETLQQYGMRQATGALAAKNLIQGQYKQH